jgi:mono/diheme cytochrome c family protein
MQQLLSIAGSGDYRRTMTLGGMKRWLAASVAAAAVLASPIAFAQNAANGATLYKSICIFCHSLPPVAGAELGANNPVLIREAIDGLVPDMRAVVGPFNFSDAQLADIAAFIAQATGQAAPPPSDPTQPPPPPPIVPDHDYSDLWWNPDESGWGVNLVQHPSNNIFAVIYTYDAARKPLWLVLSGGIWTASNNFVGALYQVAGPSYAQPVFDPRAVQLTQVGAVTLTFSDADHGTFAFTVNGIQIIKNITRQPY